MDNPFPTILKGKTVIVGIGNTLRSDDGFGPQLIRRIKHLQGIICFDAGSSPESYIGKIVKEKPDTIVIVDAVHLGEPAGTLQMLEPEEIAKAGFTTHDVSLVVLIDYIKSQIEADVYFLAVQPHNVSFGEFLSAPLDGALGQVENWLKEVSYARDASD